MLAGIGVSRTCIAWSLVVAGLALCLVDTIKLLS
jgi:hypothetical protein